MTDLALSTFDSVLGRNKAVDRLLFMDCWVSHNDILDEEITLLARGIQNAKVGHKDLSGCCDVLKQAAVVTEATTSGKGIKLEIQSLSQAVAVCQLAHQKLHYVELEQEQTRSAIALKRQHLREDYRDELQKRKQEIDRRFQENLKAVRPS
eukprot:c5561_g1_i1.p1 GENE.c5561_g1_i1~~c5561_g1_i1.p1  ORF type:complete len:151 (-),score=45.85 c5561_g1_i1:22-474(-)